MSVNHRLAVRGEFGTEDVLTIVALIMRNLTPRETRRVCNPDIALTLRVENPGDAPCFGSGGESRGKRRTHDLFQSEPRCLSENGNGDNEDENQRTQQLHRTTMIPAVQKFV